MSVLSYKLHTLHTAGTKCFSFLSVLAAVLLKPKLHYLAVSDNYLLCDTTSLSEGRSFTFISFEWYLYCVIPNKIHSSLTTKSTF